MLYSVPLTNGVREAIGDCLVRHTIFAEQFRLREKIMRGLSLDDDYGIFFEEDEAIFLYGYLTALLYHCAERRDLRHGRMLGLQFRGIKFNDKEWNYILNWKTLSLWEVFRRGRDINYRDMTVFKKGIYGGRNDSYHDYCEYAEEAA